LAFAVALVAVADVRAAEPRLIREVVRFQPQPTLYTIAVDARGFVFAGGPTGLVRASNQGFSVAWKGPKVVHSAATADGAIWAALGDGVREKYRRGFETQYDGQSGFIRFFEGKVQTYGPAEGVVGAVWSMASSKNGPLIGTRDGVLSLVGTRFQLRAEPELFQGGIPLCLAEEDSGALWVGTDKGLFRIVDKRVTPVLQTGPVWSLLKENEHVMWVGSEEGLHRVQTDGEVARVVSTDTVAQGMPSNSIWALARDAGGRLWLGSQRGLSVKLADGYQTFGLADGLLDERILSMAVDREDNLWAGTRTGGVVMLREPLARFVGPPEGLPGSYSRAIHAFPGGVTWMTASGGIIRITNSRRDVYSVGAQLPDVVPASLVATPSSDLWITTESRGLLFVGQAGRPETAPTFVRLTTEQGLPDDAIAMALAPADNELWVGWGNGNVDQLGVRREKDVPVSVTVQKSHSESTGVCRGTIVAMLRDRAGTLWGATDGAGLTRIDSQGARCLTVKDGLPTNQLTSLVEDSDGALWIGTRFDTGLVRWQNEKMVTFSANDNAIPCDSIHQLAIDPQGDIWLGCVGGIGRVRRSDLNQRVTNPKHPVETVWLHAHDGLRSEESIHPWKPGLVALADRSVWFSTLLGATQLQDLDNLKRKLPPLPEISLLTVNGQMMPASAQGAAKIVAAAGSGQIRIELQAPTYRSPTRLTSRHRLVGYQPEWTEGEPGLPAIVFDGVPPGQLLFEVQLRDGFGGEGPRLSLPIELLPGFWQRRLVWMGIACLGLLLVMGVFRVLRNQRRARRLAIKDERERIARDLHDGLAQGFTAIGLHLDAMGLALSQSNTTGNTLPDALEATRSLVERCHADARNAVWNLRAEMVEEGSLRERLGRKLAELGSALPRAGGKRPTVNLSVKGPEAAAEALIEHELMQVMVEAVTNAISHAEASRIQVQLNTEGDELLLSVEDDGVGISDADRNKPGHFGLMGMHERMRRIGGELELSRGASGGTRVFAAFPRQVQS